MIFILFMILRDPAVLRWSARILRRRRLAVWAAAGVLLGAGPVAEGQSLSFTSFTQVSNGSADLTAGAVYLFSDVAAGIDALVSIDAISAGASVTQIDNSSPPPPDEALFEYFQPKVEGLADQDHYADFTISFVDSVTGAPVSLGSLTMAAMDVDGNNVDGNTYEQVTLYGLDSYRLESGATISDSVISTSPSEVMFESTLAGGPQGISTDAVYAVEASYSDVTSISFRLGMTGTRTTDQTRLYSLNFFDTPIEYLNPVTVVVPEASALSLLGLALGVVLRRRRG